MVRFKRTTRNAVVCCGALLVLSAACSNNMSTLDPRGPAAHEVADLWWLMLILAAAVFAAVMAGLARALRGPLQHSHGRWLAAVVGGSLVILTILFVASERTMASLHHTPDAAELRVSVRGWQWWWEVMYIDATDTVFSANEIHIPTGRRVRLELTTGDVIHSLWIPNLQGKTDLVPGRTLETWIQADRPGISHGPCAEYCGVQHAHMTLVVVADLPDVFAAWLARERQAAITPADPQHVAGAAVFASAGCAYCHNVRGTSSLGKLGPDLTHFASRRTIAAALIENTPAHLSAWIADPQRVKPGTRMPGQPLNTRDLAAVVAYVSSLR